MDLKRILSLAAGSDDEAEDDRDNKRTPRGLPMCLNFLILFSKF